MKSIEKGFKKIKIEEPNIETQNNLFIDFTNIKFLICFIIIGSIILAFLVYKFFYLLSQAEQDYDYNNNKKYKKYKNYNLRNRILNYTNTNITNYLNLNNTLNFTYSENMTNLISKTINNEEKIDNNTNKVVNDVINIFNKTNENINNTQLDNHTNDNNNTQIGSHTNEINNTQLINHINENNNSKLYNHTNGINNSIIDDYTNEINNSITDNYTKGNINHTNEYNNIYLNNHTNEINNIKKFYENYSSFEEVKNLQLSLIIIVQNDKIDKNYEIIKNILKNIYDQNFTDIEIIFVDDCIRINSNSLIYEEIKKYDKRIKTLEYKVKIGNFKKIIDGVNNSNGEYLLFMDYTKNNIFIDNNALELMYNKCNESKTDIIGFEPYPNRDKVIYQPELFDFMYFGKDDFNQMKLYCLRKLLIKRELFINVTESIDNYYKEQNINHYEEYMFIFLLIKKAQSFEYLRLKTDVNCPRPYYAFIPDLKDFLLYMKFILQYSGNNVPEKRMITGIFMKEFINRPNYYNEKEDYNLTIEVIDKFATCDKISDYEEKKDEGISKKIKRKSN